MVSCPTCTKNLEWYLVCMYSSLKCSSDLEGTLLDSSGAVYGKSRYV